MSAVAGAKENKAERNFTVREVASALLSVQTGHDAMAITCAAVEEFALSLDPPRREDARWLAGWRSDVVNLENGMYDTVWGFGMTPDKAVGDLLKRVWLKNANKNREQKAAPRELEAA